MTELLAYCHKKAERERKGHVPFEGMPQLSSRAPTS